ncbi:MAG: hypothetical protein AAGA56_19705, partial [Myxococcota bacterium]
MTDLIPSPPRFSFLAALAVVATGCGGTSPPTPSYPLSGGAKSAGEAAGDADAMPVESYPQPPAAMQPPPPAGMPAPAPRAEMQGGDDAAEALSPSPAPQRRPGLATQWGEQRFSRVTTAPFSRAGSSPFGLSKLFYNDASGVDSALARSSVIRTSHFPVADGFLEVSLKNDAGGFYTGFVAGDEMHIQGRAGR